MATRAPTHTHLADSHTEMATESDGHTKPRLELNENDLGLSSLVLEDALKSPRTLVSLSAELRSKIFAFALGQRNFGKARHCSAKSSECQYMSGEGDMRSKDTETLRTAQSIQLVCKKFRDDLAIPQWKADLWFCAYPCWVIYKLQLRERPRARSKGLPYQSTASPSVGQSFGRYKMQPSQNISPANQAKSGAAITKVVCLSKSVKKVAGRASGQMDSRNGVGENIRKRYRRIDGVPAAMKLDSASARPAVAFRRGGKGYGERS